MSDFERTRRIARTQKRHVCEQCQSTIEAGSPAAYSCGRYEGDWYGHHAHTDCHDAAHELAISENRWWEEYPWWHAKDWNPDTAKWLKQSYPAVYDRLGWERFEDEDGEEADGPELVATP